MSRKARTAWLAAALLLLSSVPIFLVSLSARPMFDDFAFGEGLRNRGLAGLWQSVALYWQGWQGSFAGTVLMGVQPAAFGPPRLYGITGLVMVMLVAGAVFAIVFAALGRLARPAEKSLVACALAFSCIQWAPHIPHAFFWWNGAMYYSGAFCIMLFALAAMLVKKNAAAVCAAAFFIGGTNFVTALFFLLVCLAFLAYWAGALFFGGRRWARPLFGGARAAAGRARYAAAVFLSALGGLLVSALAPGNGYRAALYEGMGPVRAVYHSVAHGVFDAVSFLGLPPLLLLAALLPLLGKISGRTEFRFPYPLAAALLSFLLFASQNAPAMYAMGGRGFADGRISNVMHYSFMVLLYANAFYCCGHFAKKWPEKFRRIFGGKLYARVSLALFAAALVFGHGRTTGHAALAEWASGRPREFAENFDRQHALLSAPGWNNVAIPPNTAATPMFDLPANIADPTSEINMLLALFYGQSQVAALEPGDEGVFSPEFLPVDEVVKIGGHSVAMRSYWGRFSIFDVAEALAGAGLAFDFDIGNLSDASSGAGLRAGPAPDGPRRLDGFAVFRMRIAGQSKTGRFTRALAVIGGEPHLTPAQLSQVLGAEFSRGGFGFP